MPSSYIAIEFRVPSAERFDAHVTAIDAIQATELILRRSRELAWYERESLFGSEFACRVVVWVQDRLEHNEVELQRNQTDPYRALTIFDVEYEVPAELATLVEELDGKCSIVELGHLRFTTRRYEVEVRAQLVSDLEAAGGRLVRAEFGAEDQCLIGRIQGAIPKIHELEGLLRRSGLVDWDEILVEYV